jgi:dienelactone hydrolase
VAVRSMKEDDPLEDFARREITLDGVAKRVYVAGSGQAVIVMTEMPGISPHVARFARWVRDARFTVYMPSLFGRDGGVPGAEEGAAVFQRACISAEFRAMAANQSSPVTQWLRALARLAHQECGGPGVGAIGMCFTGNFALTMMLEPSLLAPVLSQPALPLNDPTARISISKILGEEINESGHGVVARTGHAVVPSGKKASSLRVKGKTPVSPMVSSTWERRRRLQHGLWRRAIRG